MNEMNTSSAGVRLIAGLAIAVLALGGCSSGNGDDNGASNAASSASKAPSEYAYQQYADVIANLRDTSTIEAVKQILADGRISESELAQIATDYQQCVAKAGVTWTPDGNGLTGTWGNGGLTTGDQSQDVHECGVDTGYDDITGLYVEMAVNPDNLSIEERNAQSLQCLKDHGLIDEGMSDQEYEDMVEGVEPGANGMYEEYLGRYLDESSPDYDAGKAAQITACGAA